MATWSTTAQVLTLTGAVVTEAQLTMAEGDISLSAGRDPATTPADALTTRDQYWLGLAVAYQAAWLAAQPDAFTRSAVTSYGDNGQSVTFAPRGQDLAPRARTALKRVSWKGTASVAVRGMAEQAALALPVGSAIIDYDDGDGSGWAENWRAL